MKLYQDFKIFILEQENKYNSQEIKLNEFFTNIDQFIKEKPKYLELILNEITKDFENQITIITSGEIGDLIKKYNNNPNLNILQIKGSIRKREKDLDLSKYKSQIKGKIILLDDSFDTGKTYFTIEKEIKKIGFKIEKSYFFYFHPNNKKTILPKNYYAFYSNISKK